MRSEFVNSMCLLKTCLVQVHSGMAVINRVVGPG